MANFPVGAHFCALSLLSSVAVFTLDNSKSIASLVSVAVNDLTPWTSHLSVLHHVVAHCCLRRQNCKFCALACLNLCRDYPTRPWTTQCQSAPPALARTPLPSQLFQQAHCFVQSSVSATSSTCTIFGFHILLPPKSSRCTVCVSSTWDPGYLLRSSERHLRSHSSCAASL